MAPLLSVENLTIDFRQSKGWVNVVNRVSLHIRAGETYALVGESGCGKTTLAYSLLGYRRPGSRIRAGRVSFMDSDLLALPEDKLQPLRGRAISLVPQNPATALSPGMRIGRQIVETLAAHRIGQSRTERHERTLELLEQVRIAEPAQAARRYPHQLSGGQQQRVVIALALACTPRLIVLDEPTTGLDVTTQAQILELLVALRERSGTALLYVTHNMGVVARIGERVGVMYAGELVEEAPCAVLFHRPNHPYTRGLIASVPSLRAPHRQRSYLLHGILDRANLPAGCRFAPRCQFAERRCFDERQALTEVAAEHGVACRRWRDVPALLTQQPVATAIAAACAEQKQRADLVEVSELRCAYGSVRTSGWRRARPQWVVDGVSFTLQAHQTFALVGESGSGKSTLARIIGGVPPSGLLQPVAGTVRFAGQDVTQPVQQRDRRLHRDIQLILQNPDASLNPRQTILHIIGRSQTLFYGLRGKPLRARVAELLADVRLDRSYAERYPDQLSGGERQRVAIARALGANPALVLCDEILSALDVSVQAEVLELLRDLQARRGMTYLFISHDLAVVRALAHQVGVLYRGQLVECGVVEEVYTPPMHPYTAMLLAAVPEVDAAPAAYPALRSDAVTPADRPAPLCPFVARCPWRIEPLCLHTAPPWQVTSASHRLRCHLSLAELQARQTTPSIANTP